MPYLFLTVGFCFFIVVLKLCRVSGRVREVLRRARNAVCVMRTGRLTDAQKERALKRATKRVGIACLAIVLGSGLATAVAISPVLAGAYGRLFDLDEVLASAADPLFLTFLVLLGVGGLKYVR